MCLFSDWLHLLFEVNLVMSMIVSHYAPNDKKLHNPFECSLLGLPAIHKLSGWKINMDFYGIYVSLEFFL